MVITIMTPLHDHAQRHHRNLRRRNHQASHWTTSQPYSRFDLKTNPMADRYGSNPGGRAVKTFDDFCQEEPETAKFNKSAENNKLNK